jgi:hypothetical protein
MHLQQDGSCKGILMDKDTKVRIKKMRKVKCWKVCVQGEERAWLMKYFSRQVAANNFYSNQSETSTRVAPQEVTVYFDSGANKNFVLDGSSLVEITISRW